MARSVSLAVSSSHGASSKAVVPTRQLVSRHGAIAGALFFLPFALIFAATVILPLVYAVYLSLFQEKMIGGRVFVGLANYAKALTDPALLVGLGRVTAFMVIQVPLILVLAVLISIAIDSGRLHFPALFRLGIFIPYAVPAVVAALMWGYIYGEQFGLVGDVAHLAGVAAPDLLSKQLILPSMANISVWQYTGYNMLIFYAGLQSISRETIEAARIDGANDWQIAWGIKVPALRPAILLTLFFSVIGGIQLFTEPSVLQALAPTTIVSDFTPTLYMYNLAVRSGQYEYAAALAITLGFFTIASVAVVQILHSRYGRSE